MTVEQTANELVRLGALEEKHKHRFELEFYPMALTIVGQALNALVADDAAKSTALATAQAQVTALQAEVLSPEDEAALNAAVTAGTLILNTAGTSGAAPTST